MPIKSILSRIAKPVVDVIDKAVVDKDMKRQLKAEMELALIETAEFFEEQITKRQELDMKSDSWLSKNIRPLALAFVSSVFVIISFADGNFWGFVVNDSYVPVYQNLLLTIYSFYFGGRSIEKSVKMYKEYKDK